MSAYKPVEGDRVRVVLEGTVDEYGDIKGDAGFCLYPNVRNHVVSIEKIEPPVVTFKPGDVVREKGTGILRLVLKDGRWAAIGGDQVSIYGPGHVTDGSHGLTSTFHELVDLGGVS